VRESVVNASDDSFADGFLHFGLSSRYFFSSRCSSRCTAPGSPLVYIILAQKDTQSLLRMKELDQNSNVLCRLERVFAHAPSAVGTDRSPDRETIVHTLDSDIAADKPGLDIDMPDLGM